MSVREQDKNRFFEHYPFGSDINLQILTGHLLIEEIIREIVNHQLPHADALKGNKGASFDCHQMICLAEAITPQSQYFKWQWNAAKKLNNLRNHMAHQLDSSKRDHKIQSLISYIRDNDPVFIKLQKKHDSTLEKQLYNCVVCLNTSFSSVKSLILESNT